MAEIKKYLNLAGAEELVNKIKEADAATLQAAKDYSDGKDKNFDAAGSSVTAEANAKKYTDEVAATLEKAGEAAKVQANLDTETQARKDGDATLQSAIDDVSAVANQNKTDIATINDETNGILAQAKADATTKTNAVQANVDELAEYVGIIPEGATATDIVGYVQEKTAGIATSENLEELTNRVAQAEKDIDNIEKDYLKTSDKTELDGKITAVQSTADNAQEYAEGVASDLTTETSERKAADEAQVARIASLEDTIIGLSGAMHFEGVKDEVPSDVTGYEQGDVIIVGNKEYVLNGGAFVEFGDASVNAEAITALTGRVDTLEGDMSQAKTDIDNVEAAVVLKAAQTALDQEIADRQAGDNAIDERLQAVESQLGTGEGSVDEKIAAAKQEAITSATTTASNDATTKANQALTDAKAYADAEDAKIESRVDALEDATHTHANQTELDLIASGDKAKWDAAAEKAHTHANQTELDKITEGDVDKWNVAEQNAKTYADNLNTAMDSRMSAVEKKASDTETALADKADEVDLIALAERVSTNETNIAANTSAINSFVAITNEEIDALFV